MQKRGQLTIFVALGLIVLIILSILFFIKKPNDKPAKLLAATTTEQVEAFLKSCVEKRTRDIFNVMENNGGNLDQKILYGNKEISLFLTKDYSSKVPQISLIENALKNEIEDNQSVKDCYEEIKDFRSAGFEINFSDYNVKVTVNEWNVDFDYFQDLILAKGIVNEVKSFRITIQSELRNFIKIANERVNSLINGEDFDLTMTLKGFENVKGEGYYVKYDETISDYEVFKLESKSETFLFAVYDPVLSLSKPKNGCCISKDGMCRQNFLNCDGQSSTYDCNSIEECNLGCCSVAQGSEFKITGKDECLVRLSTGIGNSFSSFGKDIHSLLSEDNLRQCNVRISDKGCSLTVNDDKGLRNLNMNPYTNECSFRSSQDGEHYLLSCQDGELKAEALGIDRLRVCHNNKKTFNSYQDCKTCGGVSLQSDVLLYLDPSNRVVTSFQCGISECLNKGLCKAIQSDASINSNIDCLPLYPPNNPLNCNDCGRGEDERANACNKEECESLGACSASKKPLILNNLKQSSICAGLIYVSVLNPDAANLFNANCNVDNEDLFKMFSKKDTNECKKELFSMKECNDCVNRLNKFERCTEDSCKALNPMCKFIFNGAVNCVRDNEDELDVIINSPLQNQLVSWNTISVPISISTSKNAICRYSYNADDQFKDMLKISEDFGLSHSGNLLIPYNPNDRILRATIACLGENSGVKTEFLTILVEKKPNSALPIIEDINLQNKKVDVNEKELKVRIDKSVLGCNFIDISENLVRDPGKINDFINVPPPSNVYPGRCSYISALDESECKLDINLQAGKFYFYIVNCMDSNNVVSDDLLVFFRT